MAFIASIYGELLFATIVFIMLSTALLAQPANIAVSFSKHRVAKTIRAVIANIVVVPVVGAALVFWLPLAFEVELVLYLTAIAPAAIFAPPLVHLNRGDIDWALALLFVLTALSLLTIPIMLTLATYLFAEQGNWQPVSQLKLILNYVVPVFAPLVVGLCFRAYAGHAADALTPLVVWVTKLLNLLLLVAIVVVSYEHFAAVDWPSVGVIVSFLFLAGLVGGLSLTREASRPERMTVVISTGLRNFSIVLLLLELIPDSHSVLPYVITTNISLLLACLLAIPASRRLITPTSREDHSTL